MNTFPPVDVVRSAYNWQSVMTISRCNWKHLWFSRGAYVALVRALPEDQATQLRQLVLAQFQDWHVCFKDEKTKCCVSNARQQKLHFACIE